MRPLSQFPGLVQVQPDGGLEAAALAEALGVPVPFARVLWSRGLRDKEACLEYLEPALTSLFAPEEMAGIPEAVHRIGRTAAHGGRIVVFGDYDCDGVGAVAILTSVLRRLGVDARPYIPHRLKEGYGLRLETLTAAVKEHQPEGIVTVDCGITSRDPVSAAVGQGIYVIVTDHHLPPEKLPSDAILIDPKLPGCGYPFKDLCGAGIALKLSEALLRALGPALGIGDEQRQTWVLSLARIAALSTIADMVPLTGENRVIVSLGLAGLKNPRSPGLSALLETCQVPRGRAPSPRDVAFRLAPRLNAAGRMDHAFEALDLLLTTDEKHARHLAEKLDKANTQRRHTTEQVVDLVKARLAAGFDPAFDSVIVEGGGEEEGWHRGVLGVAASRVAAEFKRPTVLLSRKGAVFSGSGRSYGRTPLHARLKPVAEGRALHFGGHANAVGITIPVDVFPEFREAVRQAFGAHRDPAEWQTEITVDTHLGLEEASESLVSYLEKLEPHGQGNPEPVFFLQSVEWDGRAKRVGENGLRFELEQKGRRIGAVGWSQAGRDREDRTGFFDVVATLQRDWLTRQPALKVLSMARPLPPA